MGYSLVTIKTDLLATQPTLESMGMNQVDFTREMEFAIQAFQKNPTLLDCKPETVKNCLINVRLAGTTLSPVMKLAYLIPRKKECCLDLSFMGLIKLITDTGSAVSISAKIVHENEPFDIELGSGGYVKHKPCITGPKGKRIGAYSLAILHNGSSHVEWMYEDQLMDIKKRAEKTGGAVWSSDIDEMCRKTVIKRHWKQLPKTERAIIAAQAIAFDDEANGIDFKKEREETNSAKQISAATPNAPSVDEMATPEDYQTLLDLLNSGKIGNPFLATNWEKVSLTAVIKRIEDQAAAGNMLKSAYEELFNRFKWEEQETNKRASEKPEEQNA